MEYELMSPKVKIVLLTLIVMIIVMIIVIPFYNLDKYYSYVNEYSEASNKYQETQTLLYSKTYVDTKTKTEYLNTVNELFFIQEKQENFNMRKLTDMYNIKKASRINDLGYKYEGVIKKFDNLEKSLQY